MSPKAGVAVSMGVIFLVATTCSGPIADWRARNIVAPLYRPLDQADVAAIQKLFEETLRSPPSREAWRHAGFIVEPRTFSGSTYLSVDEPAIGIEGKGRYLLRPGGHLAMAVQAPHGDTDLHTGEIARRLFLETSIMAATINTLPRWAVDRRGRPADLAARTDSALLAFTRAFIEQHPDGIVVQLHGFDGAKREAQVAAVADVIVSDGTHDPSPRLMALRDCLTDVASGPVRLYGDDAFELGGTHNAIGRAIRAAGAGRFLHVEMSLRFRQRLLDDELLREDFVRCLAGGIGS